MAQLCVAGEFAGTGQQGVMQEFGETRDAETLGRGHSGGERLPGLGRDLWLSVRLLGFELELISGGRCGVASIADGGEEIGVGRERGG